MKFIFFSEKMFYFYNTFGDNFQTLIILVKPNRVENSIKIIETMGRVADLFFMPNITSLQ